MSGQEPSAGSSAELGYKIVTWNDVYDSVSTIGNKAWNPLSVTAALTFEFLTGNWNDWGVPPGLPVQLDTTIKMDNLGLIHLEPAVSPENLSFDHEVCQSIRQELESPGWFRTIAAPSITQVCKALLICCLPSTDSKDLEPLVVSLKKISPARLEIVLTCPIPQERPSSGTTEVTVAQAVKRVLSVLQTGIGLKDSLSTAYYKTGAIGPVVVRGPGDVKHGLHIAIEAATHFKPHSAPVIVTFDCTLETNKFEDLLRQLVETIDAAGVNERTLLVNPFLTESTVAELLEPSEIQSAVERIVEIVHRSRCYFTISLDVWGDAGYSTGKWVSRSSFKSNRDLLRFYQNTREKLDWDAKFLPCSGLAFKGDHLHWGGEGFCRRLERLASVCVKTEGETSLCPLAANNPNAIRNIYDFLSFSWCPPAAAEIDHDKFRCDICGKWTERRYQEPFTKFAFTYCSIACLATHRRNNFNPVTIVDAKRKQ